VEEKGQKRYFQLEDMFLNYDPDFDTRKFWTYGCHCLMLGDRPMTDMGKGKPKDAIDTVCKAYKDCQRCARMKYTDSCVGEFTEYKYGYKNGDVVCKDKADTCGRALCECDAMFAKEHLAVRGVWDQQYHGFWGPNGGFDHEDPDNCPSGAGSADMQCCNNSDISAPFLWYNADKYQCCPNGKTIEIGDFC